MIAKRFLTVLAAAAVLFGACTSAATPSPTQAPTQAPTAAPPSEVPASTAPSEAPSPAASMSPLEQALFGTKYSPATGVPTGGTLVMGEWQPPDNLNPWITTAFATVEPMMPVMRGFLTITSDGKYIPDLAASIPTLENGGVVVKGNKFDVTVTLKPGLQWSDGQPLTMNDFKWTLGYVQDKGQTGCPLCTTGWPEVESIDVSADGLTATIHWKDLYSSWLGFLAGPTVILPQHYFQNVAVADFAKSMPVSDAVTKVPFSGPFVITSASKSEIDYAPNPNWHGGVSTAHAPYLAGLKFKFYGTKDGEIADFLSGNLDLALDMTQADYPAIQKVDASVGIAELEPAWQYEHLDINNDPNGTRGNGLNDVAVRKAIYEAINKGDLISKVFPGQNLVQPCTQAPPGLWYRDESVQCPAFDATQAKADLQAAGWVAGADGYVAKGGKTMDLELCTTAGNPTRLTELQLVQGYLKAVGVKSHIKTGDAAAVVFAGWTDTKPDTDCSIYRGNYDLADFAYIVTGSPYSDWFYTYATEQWPEKGDHNGSNDTRFSSKQMDDSLTALKNAVDPAQQLQLAVAVQQAYVQGIPEIPLYYRAETTGVGVHVGNWPGYAPSSIGPTWDVEDWYFKP